MRCLSDSGVYISCATATIWLKVVSKLCDGEKNELGGRNSLKKPVQTLFPAYSIIPCSIKRLHIRVVIKGCSKNSLILKISASDAQAAYTTYSCGQNFTHRRHKLSF